MLVDSSSGIVFNTLIQGIISTNTLVSGDINGNSLTYSSYINDNSLTLSFLDVNSLISGSLQSNTLTSGSVISFNTINHSTFDFSLSGTLTSKNISNIEANYADATFDIFAATIIYGDYSKQMFRRPDGTTRLGYYNNSDVFTVVNVNA
jgi:hypothetical protein